MAQTFARIALVWPLSEPIEDWPIECHCAILCEKVGSPCLCCIIRTCSLLLPHTLQMIVDLMRPPPFPEDLMLPWLQITTKLTEDHPKIVFHTPKIQDANMQRRRTKWIIHIARRRCIMASWILGV